MSFVWFQKFDAALETRETNIPEISKFNFETEISVKLQEIRNSVKEKIGIGEIIECGKKKSFMVPRIFVLTSDIFYRFLQCEYIYINKRSCPFRTPMSMKMLLSEQKIYYLQIILT